MDSSAVLQPALDVLKTATEGNIKTIFPIAIGVFALFMGIKLLKDIIEEYSAVLWARRNGADD